MLENCNLQGNFVQRLRRRAQVLAPPNSCVAYFQAACDTPRSVREKAQTLSIVGTIKNHDAAADILPHCVGPPHDTFSVQHRQWRQGANSRVHCQLLLAACRRQRRERAWP